jgi:hypothetical protein
LSAHRNAQVHRTLTGGGHGLPCGVDGGQLQGREGTRPLRFDTDAGEGGGQGVAGPDRAVDGQVVGRVHATTCLVGGDAPLVTQATGLDDDGPLGAHRKQGMGHHTLGPTGVEIAVVGVPQGRSVGHRPARIDVVGDWADGCADHLAGYGHRVSWQGLGRGCSVSNSVSPCHLSHCVAVPCGARPRATVA